MSELEYKLLDHGSIILTDTSVRVMGNGKGGVIPVTDNGRIDFDLAVVRAARTSFDAAWRAGDDESNDERLIYRLMRKRHTSPFEKVSATFEVVAPIFVYREWHRHRTQSYSEQSARYMEMPEIFFVPDPALIGAQQQTEKQAREISETIDPRLRAQREAECRILRLQNETAFGIYRELLTNGWPRELARTVLPVGTYSKMQATANLLNWFRFLELRLALGAQREIRVYAQAILKLLTLLAPVSCAAFKKFWLTTEHDI
jgi:thymidylate synthase (FAD)